MDDRDSISTFKQCMCLLAAGCGLLPSPPPPPPPLSANPPLPPLLSRASLSPASLISPTVVGASSNHQLEPAHNLGIPRDRPPPTWLPTYLAKHTTHRTSTLPSNLPPSVLITLQSHHSLLFSVLICYRHRHCRQSHTHPVGLDPSPPSRSPVCPPPSHPAASPVLRLLCCLLLAGELSALVKTHLTTLYQPRSHSLLCSLRLRPPQILAAWSRHHDEAWLISHHNDSYYTQTQSG